MAAVVDRVDNTVLSDRIEDVSVDKFSVVVEPVATAALITVDRLTAVDCPAEIALRALEPVTVFVLITVERLRLAEAALDWLSVVVESEAERLVQALTALETCADVGVVRSAVSVDRADDRVPRMLVVDDRATETVETAVLSVV